MIADITITAIDIIVITNNHIITIIVITIVIFISSLPVIIT